MDEAASSARADQIQFAIGSGEVFTARELRANFHIINTSDLALLVTDELLATPLTRVSLAYEAYELIQERLADHVSEAFPPVSSEETPPSAQVSVRGRIPIPLLRGRNQFTLESDSEVHERITFPIFYKTPIRDWVESILKALIVLITIQFFVVQTFFIPTGSMQNTLLIGDYIMVEKVSYLFEQPARGDIVVFQYPNDPTKDFIKRMVAQSGDRVSFGDQTLKVNGVALKEPYTRYDENREGKYWSMFQSERMPERIISRESLFMMGDNRDHSHDSRRWGDLPLYRVKGKAWLVYWPLRDFTLLKHFSGVLGFRNPAPDRW